MHRCGSTSRSVCRKLSKHGPYMMQTSAVSSEASVNGKLLRCFIRPSSCAGCVYSNEYANCPWHVCSLFSFAMHFLSQIAITDPASTCRLVVVSSVSDCSGTKSTTKEATSTNPHNSPRRAIPLALSTKETQDQQFYLLCVYRHLTKHFVHAFPHCRRPGLHLR